MLTDISTGWFLALLSIDDNSSGGDVIVPVRDAREEIEDEN